MSFRPTEEQEAIVDAFRQGQSLVVTAGAGTGKTSTLKLASEQAPGKRGLYLAYNKAIQLEAQSKFPKHVECRTAHSMAYQAVGKRYARRLKAPRQPAREVARLIGINEPLPLSKEVLLQPTSLARLAVDTVKRFCNSAKRDISIWNVPRLNGVTDEQHAWVQEAVYPFALKVWEDLQQDDAAGGGLIKFDHDYYLKMWQLSGAKLRYDFVLYDEAQDADPVIADIVQTSTNGGQSVVVGDSNQQLYAWRGAVDALDAWPADVRLQLSESFRFGPEIAEEANKWLTLLNSDMRITGRGPAGVVGPINGFPDAVLCRTNGEAVAQAMGGQTAGKRVALVGGGRHIIDLAKASIDLKAGRGTSHPELVAFRSWGEVQDYVQHDSTGSDLRTFVNLIDKHGAEIVIDAMERLVDDKPQPWKKNQKFIPPDLLVSTGHKAKGLEWDRVRIATDFEDPRDAEGNKTEVPKSDAMLLYVGTTRAMKHLDRAGSAWIDERLGLAQPKRA